MRKLFTNRTAAVLASLLAVIPVTTFAAETKVIRKVIACDSIGIFMLADNYNNDGDPEAAKNVIRMAFARGHCTILKKGTPVIFYHFMEYTDGDYGDKTTVHKKGDTRTWVVDKCALEGRDPVLANFKGYVVPEKPCEENSQ